MGVTSVKFIFMYLSPTKECNGVDNMHTNSVLSSQTPEMDKQKLDKMKSLRRATDEGSLFQHVKHAVGVGC